MKKIILFLIFLIIFLFQGLCLADEVIADFNNDTLPVLNNVLRKLRNDINIAGAPKGATYLTQTANTALTNEQALSSLSSGFMKVTTGTGVVNSTSKVDLGTDVQGNLSVNNLNGGSSASATTFWRGDGNWSMPISGITQSSDSEVTGVDFSGGPSTLLNVTKTVTSGNTLFIIATGYVSLSASVVGKANITLRTDDDIRDYCLLTSPPTTAGTIPWSVSSIATGLSGAVNITVNGTAINGQNHKAYGKLTVLEF